jgi:hypothetical protein
VRSGACCSCRTGLQRSATPYSAGGPQIQTQTDKQLKTTYYRENEPPKKALQ